MRSVKSGYLFFIALTLLSFNVHAQDAELKGYTPPPMFGGGSSTPLSEPPVISAPAETPLAPAPAPVIKASPPEKKLPAKVTTPPADKEQIVKDEPLPIKPLTPKKPQKPTLPPAEKNSAPKYVAPAPKPAPVIKPEPVAAPATKEIVAPGINAEALLSHPVTSQPVTPPVNPLAVPASPVEDGLPLPGSVKAKKKTPEKKTEKKIVKKAEKQPAKAEAKKKPVDKKETKKVEPKKVAEKPVEKPAAEPLVKKTEPKKEIAPKPPVEKVTDLPVPTGKPVTPVNTEIKKPVEPYNIKGRKSMPKAVPTKVDRAEIGKLPLPAIDNPSLKTLPSPNEKIIDKALEDHLVEPDVKKIIGDAAPAPKAKTKLKDTPPIISPPPAAMATAEEKKEAGFVKPELMSLEFVGDTSEMKTDQKKVINTSVIPKLNADDSRRLQILSYASPSKEGQSSARRISLARALAIRSYLLEKGVQPGRIDIRALGENTKEKPLDRVDLVIINIR